MSNFRERLVDARALRWVFLLMALWDLAGAVVQLALNSGVFKLHGTEAVSGVLAGRAFSGALFVTAAMYFVATWRPTRYRFIFWLAAFEQLIAICTGVFHGARNDITWSGVIIPIAVAIALLILLLINFPRSMREEPAFEENKLAREPPPEEK